MHPNERLARRDIELIEAGDFEALGELYADDFVFHYPGNNPLAGDYENVDDFVARAERLFGEGGALKRELHDAFGSDDHAAQLLQVTAEVGGRSHSWRAVCVMHVRESKFSEAWLHVDDQYALDDFLNSLAG
ncbi:MAG: nuclear transport factor 2 family protein [Actinomycetota bacterium]|nr:nuclear transport factor 2 family protein [Actinomycetota bacterium]